MYVLVFAATGVAELITYVIVFSSWSLVWCVAGRWFAS
jgi:hypothetical protein